MWRFGHCLHLKVPCPPRHVSPQHDDGLAFARGRAPGGYARIVASKVPGSLRNRVRPCSQRFRIYRFSAILKAFRVYGVCRIRWFARTCFSLDMPIFPSFGGAPFLFGPTVPSMRQRGANVLGAFCGSEGSNPPRRLRRVARLGCRGSLESTSAPLRRRGLCAALRLEG